MKTNVKSNGRSKWNAYQLAVFRDAESGKGHTVVRARAGTGKTTTIMEALGHVPSHLTVFLSAFNKTIAEELTTRVKMAGLHKVQVSTLHSFGFRQLTQAFGKLAPDPHRVDRIIQQKYGNTPIMREARFNLGKAVSLAKGALAETGEQVDELIDMFQIDAGETREDREEFVEDVLEVIQRCKDLSDKTIDFDDMIWLPTALDVRVWKFDRVFIDETQDLNAAQIELCMRACKKTGRITAVGDDRQAIYGFRGADRYALERIVERLKAKVLPLSVTYRCARSIVEEARTIVEDFEAPENAPEGIVRRDVTAETLQVEARAGDFVLSRTNAPLIGLCLGFLKEGRRATIQGRDIGGQLKAFIRSSKTKAIPALTQYVDQWRESEFKRLTSFDPPRDTQAVDDKAETLHALCEGAQSIAEVEARITALFDDVKDENCITLSTTHKAKGLERDRAFVLKDTYLRPRRGGRDTSEEERNLYYVAVTRARSELFLVSTRNEGRAR